MGGTREIGSLAHGLVHSLIDPQLGVERHCGVERLERVRRVDPEEGPVFLSWAEVESVACLGHVAIEQIAG
jgi:hypothetical protein